MASKRKTIIMAKLAVYEKHDARKDLRQGSYFRHDYVYKKNLALRFTALIGALIITSFYILYKLSIEEVSIFDMDIPGEIKKILLIIAVILIIYSLIGTIKYNLEYEDSSKRIKRYNSLLNLLDKNDGGTKPDKRYRGT